MYAQMPLGIFFACFSSKERRFCSCSLLAMVFLATIFCAIPMPLSSLTRRRHNVAETSRKYWSVPIDKNMLQNDFFYCDAEQEELSHYA